MSVAREAAPGRGIEDPLTVMQGGYKVSLSLVACVLVCTHECVCMSAMCSRVHVTHMHTMCSRVHVRFAPCIPRTLPAARACASRVAGNEQGLRAQQTNRLTRVRSMHLPSTHT